METAQFEALVKANQEASAKSKSVNQRILVYGVTDWKPTTKGNLPVKMVRTDKGNFFPLASSISNLPTSFSQPVEANATFTEGVDAQGKARLNLSRLEFDGLDTQKALMIREMPKGTALFS